jgi:hypothetical protein
MQERQPPATTGSTRTVRYVRGVAYSCCCCCCCGGYLKMLCTNYLLSLELFQRRASSSQPRTQDTVVLYGRTVANKPFPPFTPRDEWVSPQQRLAPNIGPFVLFFNMKPHTENKCTGTFHRHQHRRLHLHVGRLHLHGRRRRRLCPYSIS